MTTYRHKEAYALMWYASKDGRTEERLWNSRDGVTPFGLRSQDGTVELTHVRWHEDLCMPNYQPPPGMRIFVDMTPEAARVHAVRVVDTRWTDGEWAMSKRFATKDEAVAMLAASYTQHEGAPDIITVGPRDPADGGTEEERYGK